ncbi:MAG TPA: EVE domain-containing protein [Planctomycetota bacterium]|nr:EVE domain-containing protein [Planctomycetota bacterium]
MTTPGKGRKQPAGGAGGGGKARDGTHGAGKARDGAGGRRAGRVSHAPGAGAARSGGAARERGFWLLKTEPGSYSIADLERDGVTAWSGVRNYQARNTLRDQMRLGDGVLFYHSSADPPSVVGLAEVASRPRPDDTAFDPKDDHHDPASEREKPTWFLVDIRHVETFAQPLGRDTLGTVPELRHMVLLQRGSRLSVQPVRRDEFELIVRLAHAAARRA